VRTIIPQAKLRIVRPAPNAIEVMTFLKLGLPYNRFDMMLRMIPRATRTVPDIIHAKIEINFDLFFDPRAFAKQLIIKPQRDVINVTEIIAIIPVG